MAVVESRAVGRLEPAGRVGQVGTRGLEEQVIVVIHQAIGVNDYAEPLDSLLQGFEETFSVGNVAVDVFSLVSPGGDMVHGVFELDADGPCHGCCVAEVCGGVKQRLERPHLLHAKARNTPVF